MYQHHCNNICYFKTESVLYVCRGSMMMWTLEIGHIIMTCEFNVLVKTISEVRTSRTKSNMDRNIEHVKEQLHYIK